MALDIQRLLDTPIFAFDQMAIFSDVLSFLVFSESNIEAQKANELAKIDREYEQDNNLEEPHRTSWYDHQRTNALFRFEVSLPMRVRYAALTSLLATIEWSVAILRPSSPIPKAPKGKNETLHRLSTFAQRADLPLNEQLRQLEFLFWVRNSIMHNSGVLKGYRHEADIRHHIPTYHPDFSISNWHYIGDTVEIKRGAIEPLTASWRELIRDLYMAATQKGLLVFTKTARQ